MDERNTTTKYRCILNEEIVNRHDIETINDIHLELEEKLFEYITSLKDINAIIISDYNKGVITKKLCETIIEYSNNSGILTFIDPKTKNYITYKNCFCFKPNLLEGGIISNNTDKEYILNFLHENIKCKNIVLTCGEDGIYVNNINNHIKIKIN